MRIHLNQLQLGVLVASVAGAMSASASWSLSGDWTQSATTNPQWSYGSINANGTGFTALAWNGVSYGNNQAGNVFIYQNNSGSVAYGTAEGQITLESDWGNADARWTAATSGYYDISALVGGSTATTSSAYGTGFGNNFASGAVLSIDGVAQSFASFNDNVMAFSLDDVYLTAGSTVDTFVVNPGYADGGGTQAIVNITAVPETSTIVSGVMMLIPFGATTLRVLRKKMTA